MVEVQLKREKGDKSWKALQARILAESNTLWLYLSQGFQNYLCIYIFILSGGLWVGQWMTWHIHGSQKTCCRSQFSSSTRWILNITLRLSHFMTQTFTHWTFWLETPHHTQRHTSFVFIVYVWFLALLYCYIFSQIFI